MSVRDTLARRKPREVRHPIWVADPTAAAARLEEARARLLLAGIGKSEDDELVQRLQAEVDEARAALDACKEELVFVGLLPVAYEKLLQAHPRKDGAHPDDVYDEETFIPALLAACCQDSDLTAEEWAAELATLQAGEKSELTAAVMDANLTTWSAAIPKG